MTNRAAIQYFTREDKKKKIPVIGLIEQLE